MDALNTQLPGKVQYAKGCEIDSEDTSGFSEAASIVQMSTAAVLVVGLDQSQEKEGRDRTHIVRAFSYRLLYFPAIVRLYMLDCHATLNFYN